MRKSLYILGTLLALALISCSAEGSAYSTPALEVKSSDVIFSYEGGNGNSFVEADGTVMHTSNAD